LDLNDYSTGFECQVVQTFQTRRNFHLKVFQFNEEEIKDGVSVTFFVQFNNMSHEQ